MQFRYVGRVDEPKADKVLASVKTRREYEELLKGVKNDIKKLRKGMGLTQVQLAQSLGTTQKVIADYEMSRSKPPRKRLPHSAWFFDISVDELIGDDDLPEPTNGKTGQHHGNSRTAHAMKLFDRLGEEEQRVILKQMKALAEG